MLKIQNLTKSFGEKIAVNDISLNVEGGDIFAFIGHNGAGKTTTIKCVVGINQPTSGDVFVNGISVKENALECKKQLAYIPDNPDVYESLTGIQYINLVADIYRVDKATRRELTVKYATELELIDDLNSPISTYSHGMKQKLVLISAFVHSPKLMILDEPFVGLDPKASFTVKNLMKEFRLQEVVFSPKCILFHFYDNPGTMKKMEALDIPQGYHLEWKDLSYQEKKK